MMVACVSRASEEKSFPQRRDRCFTHVQPIRRPLLGHVTCNAWFLENFLEQANMAVKHCLLLQDEEERMMFVNIASDCDLSQSMVREEGYGNFRGEDEEHSLT